MSEARFKWKRLPCGGYIGRNNSAIATADRVGGAWLWQCSFFNNGRGYCGGQARTLREAKSKCELKLQSAALGLRIGGDE